MRRREKDYLYSKLARRLLAYIEACADHHVAPLKHDASLFSRELTRIDNARLS